MKKLLIAAMFAATMSAPAFAGCYSEGIRTGIVQKLSKKGMFVKTWEGEMVMDGLKDRRKGGFTNVWKFSIDAANVASQVEGAAMSGKEVTVKYCQKYLAVTTGTDYVITEVVLH